MDNGWVCLSDYSCVSILVVLCVCIFIEQHVTAILLFFCATRNGYIFISQKVGSRSQNAFFFNPTVKFC